MRNHLPSSLAHADRVTQGAVWLAGALTMVELLLLCRWNETWIPFVTFYPPILSLAFATGPLVRRQWRKLGVVALVALAVHALIGLACAIVVGARDLQILGIIVLVIGVLFTVTAIASVPVLVVGMALSRRRDHEAGDAMLGWSGAWLVLVQLVAIGVTTDGGTGLAMASLVVAIAGLGVGLLAIGTFAGRAITRRRWCARAVRGELSGWRVRDSASPDELAHLPPMFGSPRHASAVLERVELGGALYRSGLVTSPVAAVRVRRPLERLADLGTGLP